MYKITSTYINPCSGATYFLHWYPSILECSVCTLEQQFVLRVHEVCFSFRDAKELVIKLIEPDRLRFKWDICTLDYFSMVSSTELFSKRDFYSLTRLWERLWLSVFSQVGCDQDHTSTCCQTSHLGCQQHSSFLPTERSRKNQAPPLKQKENTLCILTFNIYLFAFTFKQQLSTTNYLLVTHSYHQGNCIQFQQWQSLHLYRPFLFLKLYKGVEI